ncbi:MAG: helix-turn-helix domain-containing protein [Streptosporangiaceae bacterium]
MESWRFLTNHARVLVCIAQDPDLRLRDAAAALGITERSAYGIITDLTAAGYVVKQKCGRRNRYQIQSDLPLPGPGSHEPAIGDVLALLSGNGVSPRRRRAARVAPASTTGPARPLADARASGPGTPSQ